MDTVALIACRDYRQDEVDRALTQALEKLGGLGNWIKPGMRVVIKANLLLPKHPQAAATTHPAVIHALVRAVQAAGAQPLIADCPGGPDNRAYLKHVYEACGMADVARQTGAELMLDTHAVERPLPAGSAMKTLLQAAYISQADAVITVGKLKTHGLAAMTGCVKNLYGTVPGVTKADYHYRLGEIKDFAGLLLDIERDVRPVLSVLDAVIGMEGAGPSNGTPRPIGALVVGQNAHAVDDVGARLIGYRRADVPTLALAQQRGLIGEYTVVGQRVEDLAVPDFKRVTPAGDARLLKKLPRPVHAAVRKLICPHPVFHYDACVGCGACIKNCPPKALEARADKKPRLRAADCIACFCCQELCPRGAITIKRGPIR
nr:DUF362 domain-containing protein [bacterium]